MRNDLAPLVATLAARAETLCRQIMPYGKIVSGEYVASGSDTGFGKVAVVLRGGKTGRVGFWAGRPDDPGKDGGDLLHLIMATQSLTLREAIRWAEEWCGGAAVRLAPVPERREAERSDAELLAWKLKRAKEMWDRSTPDLAGTLAESYLRARGIRLDMGRFSPDIRFARRLEHWRSGSRGPDGRRVPGQVFPALVAALRQADGTFSGVHCTFLAPDGSGKAAVDAPKLMMGAKKGAVICLQEGQPGGLVVVNEGIENGATVMMAHGKTERALVAPDVQCFQQIRHADECAGALVVPHNDWTNEAAIGAFQRGLAALRAQGKPVRVMRAADDVNDPNDMVRG